MADFKVDWVVSAALVDSVRVGRRAWWNWWLGGGLGGIGGIGGFGGRNRNFNQTGQQGQANTRRAVKATFKPDLEFQEARMELRSSQIQTRLERLPLAEKYRNIQVKLDGRTAILVGTVNSINDARFIERIVRLEPGVDNIVNELSCPMVVPLPRSQAKQLFKLDHHNCLRLQLYRHKRAVLNAPLAAPP